MKPTPVLRLVAALALAGAGAAYAVDPLGSPAPGDKLAPARAHIADKRWSAAVDELKKVNDVNSADWNNLMGFALRKADAANYADAERHYNDALRLDPKHKGALEYSGELYLMRGDLPMAEQRLAALGKACFLPCSEQRDLKRQIERFKANGNKYVEP